MISHIRRAQEVERERAAQIVEACVAAGRIADAPALIRRGARVEHVARLPSAASTAGAVSRLEDIPLRDQWSKKQPSSPTGRTDAAPASFISGNIPSRLDAAVRVG